MKIATTVRMNADEGPGTVLNILLYYLISPHNCIWTESYNYPHFTDDKTKIQKDEVTCPNHVGGEWQGPDFNLSSGPKLKS